MKKIPAYLLMIFITVMTSRILDILWLAFYSSTNIDIFKITGLFELTAPSTNWTPNTAFGASLSFCSDYFLDNYFYSWNYIISSQDK